MIKTLRTTNIFNVLNAIPAITALVEVFSEKPNEEYLGTDSYLYLSKVTDPVTTASDSGINWWSLIKQTIVTFAIVAWLNTIKTDTDELYDIVDVINQEIVSEWCVKISQWDTIRVKAIDEWSPATIVYNTKNRAVLLKQYLFTYYAK